MKELTESQLESREATLSEIESLSGDVERGDEGVNVTVYVNEIHYELFLDFLRDIKGG